VVATVHQHGTGDSGGLEDKASPKKDAERRDKVSIQTGKDTQPRHGWLKPSDSRRYYKRYRWHVTKCNLRVKRSDPWCQANASPKAMAVLVQMVKTRNGSYVRVLSKFASRRPASAGSKRAKRPHSIIQRPQGAGRPCYEAENSAGRGEWRREAGSPARVRLMSAWEREHGELPAPNLSC